MALLRSQFYDGASFLVALVQMHTKTIQMRPEDIWRKLQIAVSTCCDIPGIQRGGPPASTIVACSPQKQEFDARVLSADRTMSSYTEATYMSLPLTLTPTSHGRSSYRFSVRIAPVVVRGIVPRDVSRAKPSTAATCFLQGAFLRSVSSWTSR